MWWCYGIWVFFAAHVRCQQLLMFGISAMKRSPRVVDASSRTSTVNTVIRETCSSATRPLQQPKELRSHGGKDQNPINEPSVRAVQAIRLRQATCPRRQAMSPHQVPFINGPLVDNRAIILHLMAQLTNTLTIRPMESCKCPIWRVCT